MTTKSAVLLTIKQKDGIDYNGLLSMLATNYSTANSARAALSRTMKDLRALGFVEKRSNKFYVTEKAAVSLYSEMKSKLIMKLNSQISTHVNYHEIDSIVKSLHTLIERSKEDPDLLKAARSSTTFFIKDLEEISKKLEAEMSHLNYLSSIFKEQINNLRSLDFNDVAIRENKAEISDLIEKMAFDLGLETVSIDSNNETALQKIAELCESKVKGQNLVFKTSGIKKAIEFITTASQGIQSNSNFNIYLPPLKIKFSRDSVQFSGSHSILQKYKV